MLTFLLTLVGDDSVEQERFRYLYDKYYKHMYFRAMSYMKNKDDALDVLQESFIRVAKNFSKFEDLDSNSTKHFLLTIVDNQAKTELAAIARRKKSEERFIDKLSWEKAEARMSEDLTEQDLIELVGNIPEKYRRPLYLYYVDGMTAKEIGSILNISHAAVRKRIERARAMFREIVEAQT